MAAETAFAASGTALLGLGLDRLGPSQTRVQVSCVEADQELPGRHMVAGCTSTCSTVAITLLDSVAVTLACTVPVTW